MTVGPICGNPSSSYKFLSQKASRPASESATYSDSVEDIAIIVCFLDFHVIAPPTARSAGIICFQSIPSPSEQWVMKFQAIPLHSIAQEDLQAYRMESQ